MKPPVLFLIFFLLLFIQKIKAQPPCTAKNDFSFSQEACNPLNVNFLTNATGFNSIKWEFGDGNTATAFTLLNHLYGAYGNYTVKMILDYGACADTVTKSLSVTLQTDNQLIGTSDTTICAGASKQLTGAPSLNFCWTPASYLDNPNISNPTTTAQQNITYYYTAEFTGPNLIVNGNFNAGNSGFTSQYNYANPNTTEGEYFVGTNPQAWNVSLSPCGDHTSGNGLMMLVNGSPVPDVEVWKQTITVSPNTNYTFSTWIQALWPPNPAQLQFSINGNTIGSLITASLPTCTWTQFHTNWNSGTTTTATISIVNKNTAIQGNDFALDDISFSTVILKKDSVKISVTIPSVTCNNDTAICKGSQVQLKASGASTYSWSPAAGLNNPNIPDPVASPSVTAQYIVTGITTDGCSAKDTIVVTVNNGPVVTKSNDTTICTGSQVRLSASGGTGYNWTPASTLNNPGIPDPVASPIASTTYYVTVTGSNTCTTIDSVRINVRTPDNFSVSPSVSACKFKPVQLNASGGDVYFWSPSAGLSDVFISNPFAAPSASTTYSVLITDTLCGFFSSLETSVTVLELPDVKANKTNDINCVLGKSTLIGAGARKYNWTPVTGLISPGSGTTAAIPSVTTKYSVTGIDQNGCENSDSVILYVTKEGKSDYLMPTAFTPNNDGLNDCYGIKYWGQILNLEFSIYNRWGERIFFTTNPSACWDGIFHGEQQSTGIYVYMIRAKTSCQDQVFRKGTFALIR